MFINPQLGTVNHPPVTFTHLSLSLAGLTHATPSLGNELATLKNARMTWLRLGGSRGTLEPMVVPGWGAADSWQVPGASYLEMLEI